MPWVRFDDEYDDHPKIEAGGPLVQLLHVKAIVWCARTLSDGRLPRARAELLAFSILARVGGGGDAREARDLVTAAVDVGLFDEVDDVNGDLEVHDYLEFQPSKEKVEKERKAARKRQRKHRSKEASQ